MRNNGEGRVGANEETHFEIYFELLSPKKEY
jgi:hypothetical protein